jgi:general stress protein 26
MTESNGAGTAWTLIERLHICMLVTRQGEALRARPMAAYVRREKGLIYFLTDVKNHKDDEIAAAPQVCLAFADKGEQDYVSVSGTARVLNDRTLVRELWSTPAKAWWDSADDPAIRVLEVTPQAAEYWDSPGGLVSYVKMQVAAMSGERPDMGENRKVVL